MKFIKPFTNVCWQFCGLLFATVIVVLLGSCKEQKSQLSQSPSPMVDFIRPHDRVDGSVCKGERVTLTDVFENPVQLFIPAHISKNDTIDLLIHFHGSSKVTEWLGCELSNNVVVVTINLGSGSSRYERPLLVKENREKLFTRIEDEIAVYDLLVSETVISGFSAGYGAIRALLNSPDFFERIDGVILLDGLHTGYIPDEQLMSDGGELEADKLQPFIKLGKEAAAGKKRFLFTHSSIFPGTYASTTECADYIINELDLERRPDLKPGPLGMQQLGSTEKGGLKILAFAGNTAPDHVDHLHALSFFVSYLME